MTLYDTKVIVCTNCKTAVGEIEFDALIIRPLCGQCANPLPESEKIRYVPRYYQNKSLVKVPQIG